MVIEIVGQIYRVGQSKKGQNYLNILIPRPDGQSDSVTIFTQKDGYKAGQQFKGKVNVFVRMCSEV